MIQDHVFINGKKILVSDWSFTVFQLCDSLDIKIPRFCYHERLSIAGNCRMCMVEVSSAIKPLVSCATPLSKGMSILTDSALVKKAREGVLEFLLINHPLDCPICDQGGECDLQDQSIVYGADKGRFLETKRSVEDKNFGPIVKTVMTRCIHCTRCVRFFEEIAGNPVVGTMGRGKDTEISTYLSSSILSSSISGNVVDLCPVGALTSKPHAFLYRSWELVSSESIDTLDSLCSSIRVDMKGSEIVRILPRRNDIINQDWITDKTRYSFDGLKNQRFSYPMLYTKEDGCFKLSNWNAFFSSFMLNHLSSVGTSFSGNLTLGGGLDLYTIYLSNLLTKSLSSFSLSGNVSSSVSDFRSSYLSFPLSDIQSSSVVFLSGLNLARSFPLINVRVQQKVNSKHPCIVLYNGTSYNFSYDVSHFGLTYESTFSLLRGKHVCSSYLSASKSSVFFSSEHLETFTSFLPSSLSVRTNVLMSNTSLISSSELGLLRSDLGSSSFYYGINVSDCPSLTTVSHCVLHSTHSNLSLSLIRSHENLLNVWYLPSFSSFETELPYINLLGIVQWTRKCSSSFGESSTYEDVLRRLISLSSLDTSNLSFDQFLNRVPSLVGSSLPVISFKLSTVIFEDKNLFSTVETEVPFTRFSFLSTASN